MIHPGSASPPFPTVMLLPDGCPAALPPTLAAAGRHLGLSLRCESTRVTLKLSVPQPMWDGGSELSAVSVHGLAFQLGVEGGRYSNKAFLRPENSALA